MVRIRIVVKSAKRPPVLVYQITLAVRRIAGPNVPPILNARDLQLALMNGASTHVVAHAAVLPRATLTIIVRSALVSNNTRVIRSRLVRQFQVMKDSIDPNLDPF